MRRAARLVKLLSTCRRSAPGGVAPEPRRFAIGRDRLLAAFEPHQRVAEIVLRLGEIRLARDGGGILRRRLGDIAELHRDLAGKRHHIGAAALEGEQAAARVERLAAPAGTIERRDLLEQRRWRHLLLSPPTVRRSARRCPEPISGRS